MDMKQAARYMGILNSIGQLENRTYMIEIRETSYALMLQTDSNQIGLVFQDPSIEDFLFRLHGIVLDKLLAMRVAMKGKDRALAVLQLPTAE